MKIFIVLFIAILFISCQTNPPTTPISPIQEYGTIKIISNIDSVRIYLDSVDTGKQTPDTIKTTVGNHIVKLIKAEYDTVILNVTVVKNTVSEINVYLFATDKVVLIEDFANVSCIPCVTSNKIIEQLTNQTFGRKRVVAVKFATNFPSPIDPFYLANETDCNSRMQYYNIIVAPTNIINGKIRPIPSDSNDVKDKILSELVKIPQFVIDVNHNISGNTYNINISIEIKDITNLDLSKLVLHTVVTETNIEFATPPGSNGETKFYDVMRKMLPTNQGESLSSINQIGTYNFQRQITLDTYWNQSNINTVVYIQNKDTKEIFQAGSTF